MMLRKITQAKWLKGGPLWHDESCPSADSLLDLKSKDNTLSVWSVENEKEIARVVTGLASNCETVANLDYGLFSNTTLSEIKGSSIHVPGATPFKEANPHHINLVRLSAEDIIVLARVIYTEQRIVRVQKPEIAKLLGDAIRSEKLLEADLKADLLEELRRLKAI